MAISDPTAISDTHTQSSRSPDVSNQHAIKGLTSAAIWRPVMKACSRDWPSRSTKSESVSP